MLTTDQQYILSLLRESLKREKTEPITPIDSHVASNIIIRNGILLTVYTDLTSVTQGDLFHNISGKLKQRQTEGTVNPNKIFRIKTSTNNECESELFERVMFSFFCVTYYSNCHPFY